MKNVIKTIITVIIAIVITVFIVIYFNFFRPIDYFNQIGIRHSHYRTDVIHDIGVFKNSELTDDKTIKDYYEDMCITYRNTPSGYFLENIKVTGAKYRIGRTKIGVGSTYDDIQREFQGKQKIIDLKENECGYIDGFTWIEFGFKNNIVDQIIFYSGA